jgi:uncharacterized protein
MNITEQEVRAFLHAQPDWLQEHAVEFGLRPVEKKILSFQQGNMLALKRKTEKMTKQLAQMLADAENNQVLMAKFMNFHQRLLAVETIPQWLDSIADGLLTDFSLPQHIVRILVEATDNINIPNNLLANAEVKAAASKITKPLCGVLPAVALMRLFPDQPRLESFVQLPLRWYDKTIAILIIGHEEATHFQAGQSTEWISAMADSLAIILARLMKLAI